MKKYPYIILLICLQSIAFSQDTKFAFTGHYSYQLPAGDLSSLYGNNSNVGGNINVKLSNNFTFGIEGQFIFGSSFKDYSLLGNMVTSDGFIIGTGMSPEVPDLEGRGGNFFVEIGKIFPLYKSNLNSGLHAKFGLGYAFYSTYVNIDQKIVTQLSGNYSQGYNRLQSGLSYNSFLGYTFYGKDKFFNASAGIQIMYSSMTSQGTVDFATGIPIDNAKSNSNFLIGSKVSFSIILKTINRVDPKADGFFYN